MAEHDIHRGTHLNPWTQSVRDIPEDDPIPRIDDHGWTFQVDPLCRWKLEQQRLLLGVVHTRFTFGEGLVVPDDVDVQLDWIKATRSDDPVYDMGGFTHSGVDRRGP
jgi:hypothetical protein